MESMEKYASGVNLPPLTVLDKWTITISDMCTPKYILYDILTCAHQNTQCSKIWVLDLHKDIQCFMALCVLDCQNQKQYQWCYLVTPTEIHIVPEIYMRLTPAATWTVTQLDVTPVGAIPNQIYHMNVGQIFNSNQSYEHLKLGHHLHKTRLLSMLYEYVHAH